MRSSSFLLLVLCFFSFGCSSLKKHEKKDVLRLNFISDVNSLDPRFGYEIPANHAVKMLYEGLMRHTPDGKLIPAACEKVEISKDQKKYVFFIRDALWSNGEKVTAYDFECAWKSMVDPQIPTQGTADFYPIKNVQAIAQGKLPLDTVGISAIDEKTLMVELEYPAPYFLQLTASSAFSPIFKGLKDDKELYWVSNGPFRLKKWNPQDCILLEKNPFYWNQNQVDIKRIEISIVPDAHTQLALYEKNEADWFGKPFAKLPLDAVPTLKEKNELSFFPERAVYWYFFNTEKFPFTHSGMRKAFSLAINRKEIVSHILKENEEIAVSINRGYHFFQDADTENARELFNLALEEMGIEKENFPKIKLSFCNMEINFKIAAAVQEMWQKNFGIKVELDPQEWTIYYDRLCSGDFLIGGMSWHSRIQDPIYNLQLFQFKDDRLNMSNWEDIRFQKFITEAQKEHDPEIRLKLLSEAEKFLMEEMPIIPIYFLTISFAKNSLLKGVYLSDLNEIDFAFASKRDRVD